MGVSGTVAGNPPSMVEPSTARGCGRRRTPRVRPPHVGVVVLNWRRPREILTCLASVGAQDYPSFEIVVVDNGSANGSVSSIRRQCPAAWVIENGRNLGFAAGSNRGIDFLVRRGVDYVLLLNDDATCDKELLSRLIAHAEAEPDIGILGPTIFYADAPGNVIWSAGGIVDRLGRSRHLRVGESVDGPAPPARDVDYVTGCAILIRRDVIEKVGMLDERFFAYWEEVEWCARARAAGFRVVQLPDARVWHGMQQVERETSRVYQYLMTRNRLLFVECVEGRRPAVVLAGLEILRTALAWSVKPRHRAMRPYVGVLLRALRDYTLRRFGPPPLAA
jgi:GT2 family glycosyltransferase